MKKIEKNKELLNFLSTKFKENKKSKGLKHYYFHHFISSEIGLDVGYYYNDFYTYKMKIPDNFVEKVSMALSLNNDDITYLNQIVEKHNLMYKKYNMISDKKNIFKECSHKLQLLMFWQERPDISTAAHTEKTKQDLFECIEKLVSNI